MKISSIFVAFLENMNFTLEDEGQWFDSSFFEDGTQIKIPSEVIQPLTAFIAPALARVKQLWSGEFN